MCPITGFFDILHSTLKTCSIQYTINTLPVSSWQTMKYHCILLQYITVVSPKTTTISPHTIRSLTSVLSSEKLRVKLVLKFASTGCIPLRPSRSSASGTV